MKIVCFFSSPSFMHNTYTLSLLCIFLKPVLKGIRKQTLRLSASEHWTVSHMTWSSIWETSHGCLIESEYSPLGHREIVGKCCFNLQSWGNLLLSNKYPIQWVWKKITWSDSLCRPGWPRTHRICLPLPPECCAITHSLARAFPKRIFGPHMLDWIFFDRRELYSLLSKKEF